MQGYADGTFQPDKSITRSEVVSTINRVLKRGPLYGMESPSWTDVTSDHWAYHDIEEASKEHHYFITEEGIENLKK
jgi:hypothetical protein